MMSWWWCCWKTEHPLNVDCGSNRSQRTGWTAGKTATRSARYCRRLTRYNDRLRDYLSRSRTRRRCVLSPQQWQSSGGGRYAVRPCHRHARSPTPPARRVAVHPQWPSKRDRLSWSSAASHHKRETAETLSSAALLIALELSSHRDHTHRNSRLQTHVQYFRWTMWRKF